MDSMTGWVYLIQNLERVNLAFFVEYPATSYKLMHALLAYAHLINNNKDHILCWISVF